MKIRIDDQLRDATKEEILSATISKVRRQTGKLVLPEAVTVVQNMDSAAIVKVDIGVSTRTNLIVSTSDVEFDIMWKAKNEKTK